VPRGARTGAVGRSVSEVINGHCIRGTPRPAGPQPRDGLQRAQPEAREAARSSTMTARRHGDPQRADRRARVRAERAALQAAARGRLAAVPRGHPVPRRRNIPRPRAPLLAESPGDRSSAERARSVDPRGRRPDRWLARPALAAVGPSAKLRDDDRAPAEPRGRLHGPARRDRLQRASGGPDRGRGAPDGCRGRGAGLDAGRCVDRGGRRGGLRRVRAVGAR